MKGSAPGARNSCGGPTPRRGWSTRSPAEFSGELIAPGGYEQEGAQRAGHIPGAVSIPWARAVREDGTFKASDELCELYGDAGVLDGNPIIAYCGTGERAAHTWFVRHELLGHPPVQAIRRLLDRVGQSRGSAHLAGWVSAAVKRRSGEGRA